MRTLFYDIESTPELSWTYGKKHDARILKVKQPSYILSIAWRWSDKKKVEVVGLGDFPGYRKDRTNDKRLLEKFRDELDAADFTVAHNQRFDIRKLRARMIYHQIDPFTPVKELCTLKMARRDFLFQSNSLADLAEYLGLKNKLKVDSGLWLGIVEDGDDTLWPKMKRYNRIDVEVLHELYYRFEPWVKEITPMNGCDHSGETRKAGWTHPTAAGWQYHQMRCNDCTKVFRDKQIKRKHPEYSDYS